MISFFCFVLFCFALSGTWSAVGYNKSAKYTLKSNTGKFVNTSLSLALKESILDKPFHPGTHIVVLKVVAIEDMKTLCGTD